MPLAQKVTGVGLTGATAAGSAMTTAPAPYDSQLQSVANPAIVTFPATPGKQWVLSMISASVYAIAGASVAYAAEVIVKDGANVIWRYAVTTSPILATGAASAGVALTGLALIGTVNTAMVVTYSAASPANVYQDLSAGAYLI